MNTRRIVKFVVPLVLLTLILPGTAGAIYVTGFFTSVQLTVGSISGGTLNMVQTIDGNTLNLTEGSSASGDLRYLSPTDDNGSGFGWANNCGGIGYYFNCLADIVRGHFNVYPFTDYNATIVASTALPNNQSVKPDTSLYLFTNHAPILSVGLYIVARKNQTGAVTFNARILDPIGNKVCVSTAQVLSDLAWHIIPTIGVATCAGAAWTYELLNRTEINLNQQSPSGSKVAVSSAYWVVQTSARKNLDVYFNATVNPTAQIPYSVNWTCNRTAEDSYILYAFRQSPTPAWVFLNGNACPTGAQTSTSIILPVGTWVSGNKFSVRVQGYGALNAGTVRFDRLIFVVNQPTAGFTGKGIGGFDLTWLVFFFLIMSAMLLTAFKVKTWREQ